MSFITAGLALAGALAMSVPIIIHLLSRRRRTPIEWAAMRFLLEAFRKHKRRLQIEQLILLALRCLVLLLLGMALARPLLSAAGMLDSGTRVVMLVIDNGVISSAQDGEGTTALARLRQQALSIVNELGPGDRVGIVIAARPANGLLVPPSGDLGAVRRLIENLDQSQAASDVAGAISRLRDAIDLIEEDEGEVIAYLLSDFREGAAALDTPLGPALEELGDRVRLVATPPVQERVSNVRISAIEPVRSVIIEGASDGSGQLTVRLKRSGELEREVSRVRLSGPDLAAIEPKPVFWQPGQSEAEVDFVLDVATSGDRQIGVTASIDSDALEADDQRYLVIDLRTRIRAVLLDRRTFGFEPTIDRLTAGQWINRALDPGGEGSIELITVEPAALSPADLRAVDVVIAPRHDLLADRGWELLGTWVDDGGLLVLMPPGEANVHQWAQRLQSDLGLPWQTALEVVDHAEALRLADEQPRSELLRMLSSELDRMARAVVALRTLPVDASQTQAQRILEFADGSPLLILGAPVNEDGTEAAATGLVALLTVAPEVSWTNLPVQVLMVPLCQELIRQGLSIVRQAQEVEVGDQPALWISRAAARLQGTGGAKVPIDSQLRPSQPLPAAALYVAEDRANQPVGLVAVNVAGSATATGVLGVEAVSNWLRDSGPWEVLDSDDLGATLRVAESAAPIAGWLLMAVLALALIETVLARLFSHARAGAETGTVRAGTYDEPGLLTGGAPS